MSTYTIALATRLKRKVFRAGNIPVDVMEMIGDALRVNGMHLDGHRFYDYGVVLCVECGGIAGRSGRNTRNCGRCRHSGTSLPA